MFVRTVYATGHPDRIEQTLDRLRTEAPALLGDRPGYRGYGLFADRALGKITMGSWWESAQDERDSDAALGERRRELLAPLGGTVATDVWEAAVTAPPGAAGPGAGFRLVRGGIGPDGVDRLAEVFRDRALPNLEKLDGFVTGALLVDRANGRTSVGAIFADRASFTDSRGPMADIRAQATAAAGLTVWSLEEFDVVLLDRPPQD
ncbi:antibiotic biosynthesis monooxygenase [Kitasatospora sp. NPDC001539]|uniref:antibiotic biosynthesis monooxygenase n=1 Tax=Kitasatospora sp. NPDC001539 TaxID=3154384 RepID=UPI00331A5BBC